MTINMKLMFRDVDKLNNGDYSQIKNNKYKNVGHSQRSIEINIFS